MCHVTVAIVARDGASPRRRGLDTQRSGDLPSLPPELTLRSSWRLAPTGVRSPCTRHPRCIGCREMWHHGPLGPPRRSGTVTYPRSLPFLQYLQACSVDVVYGASWTTRGLCLTQMVHRSPPPRSREEVPGNPHGGLSPPNSVALSGPRRSPDTALTRPPYTEVERGPGM